MYNICTAHFADVNATFQFTGKSLSSSCCPAAMAAAGPCGQRTWILTAFAGGTRATGQAAVPVSIERASCQYRIH